MVKVGDKFRLRKCTYSFDRIGDHVKIVTIVSQNEHRFIAWCINEKSHRQGKLACYNHNDLTPILKGPYLSNQGDPINV